MTTRNPAGRRPGLRSPAGAGFSVEMNRFGRLAMVSLLLPLGLQAAEVTTLSLEQAFGAVDAVFDEHDVDAIFHQSPGDHRPETPVVFYPKHSHAETLATRFALMLSATTGSARARCIHA